MPPANAATTKKNKKRPQRVKHVPIRTCVSCRETGAKRGLTRIVRTPEREIVIDPTGKRNGRGAYLCDKPSCWKAATSTNVLSRALNIELTPETHKLLNGFAASLDDEPSSAPDAAYSEEPAS